MGDFTTKKRFILALLALLLAMDGALAFSQLAAFSKGSKSGREIEGRVPQGGFGES